MAGVIIALGGNYPYQTTGLLLGSGQTLLGEGGRVDLEINGQTITFAAPDFGNRATFHGTSDYTSVIAYHDGAQVAGITATGGVLDMALKRSRLIIHVREGVNDNVKEFGMDLFIADQLSAQPEDEFYIVKASRGGQRIANWLSGGFDEGLLGYTKDAVEALAADGKVPYLSHFTFFQGESESVRCRMIWNSLADFGPEGAGSSVSGCAA